MPDLQLHCQKIEKFYYIEGAANVSQSYLSPFAPTPAGNNRIEFNHIHHVMDPLQDGGGIYTLGNMAGTVIRGNHIHDNPGVPGGIYLDEGSGFIEVTGNVVYNVRTPMNYNNRNQNRIATCNEHDNWFKAAPGALPEVEKITTKKARLGGTSRSPSAGTVITTWGTRAKARRLNGVPTLRVSSACTSQVLAPMATGSASPAAAKPRRENR